jgi:hypothetical protein
MVAAKGEEIDRVFGFEVGADDPTSNGTLRSRRRLFAA